MSTAYWALNRYAMNTGVQNLALGLSAALLVIAFLCWRETRIMRKVRIALESTPHPQPQSESRSRNDVPLRRNRLSESLITKRDEIVDRVSQGEALADIARALGLRRAELELFLSVTRGAGA